MKITPGTIVVGVPLVILAAVYLFLPVNKTKPVEVEGKPLVISKEEHDRFVKFWEDRPYLIAPTIQELEKKVQDKYKEGFKADIPATVVYFFENGKYHLEYHQMMIRNGMRD